MLSDYSKTKELLTELGIGFQEEASSARLFILLRNGDAKIEGYNGFYTRFTFHLNGDLIKVGAFK